MAWPPPLPHCDKSVQWDLQELLSKTIAAVVSCAGAVAEDSWELSLSDWAVKTVKDSSFEARYELGVRELGTGCTGAVLQAFCRKTGSLVAVKIYRKSELKVGQMAHMRAERDALGGLKHPGIVRLEGVHESDKTVHTVMEQLDGGEVFARLAEVGRFTEEAAADVARQVLHALVYLHSRRVVHRDVKLENLMYERKDGDTVKLIDFGFATKLAPGEKLTETVGTLQYVAPEVLLNHEYDEKVDVWSFGTVMYTLLTGTPLFGGSRREIVKRKTGGKVYYSTYFRTKLSEDAKAFVRLLLSLDPEARPSAEEALRHPWLLEASSTTTSGGETGSEGTSEPSPTTTQESP